MSRPTPWLALLLVMAPFAGRAQEPAPPPKEELPPNETSCYKCHMELDSEGPTKNIQADVHFRETLGCHGCHGGNPKAGFEGDPDAAHDESMGWRPAPKRTEIPEFCARCHSDPNFMKRFDPHARVDQLDEYRTSKHGHAVLGLGDPKPAVCIDCHGVHGIRGVKDPRSSVYPTNVADTCGRCHTNADLMGAYDIKVNPFPDYKRSVHAEALYGRGDLSAPTCNDCHGNHGAVPPGVESIAHVCGACHSREATLFRETEAKDKVNLSPCIRCVICHSNHAVLPPNDEMLGVGPKSTCTGCHARGDKQYQAAAEMRESMDRLKSSLEESEAVLHSAERAGVEVSQDIFELEQAKTHLVNLRVLAHSFDKQRFAEEADKGIQIAEAGIQAGRNAFHELRYRRIGLSLSLIVIALVITALIFKIRDLEGPDRPGEEGPD